MLLFNKLRTFINTQCYFGYYDNFSFTQLLLFIAQLTNIVSLISILVGIWSWVYTFAVLRFNITALILLVVAGYYNKQWAPKP